MYWYLAATLASPDPALDLGVDAVQIESQARAHAISSTLLDPEATWTPQAEGPGWTLSTTPVGVARLSRDGAPIFLEPLPIPRVRDFMAPMPRPSAGDANDTHAVVLFDNGDFAVYDLRTQQPPMEEGWPPLVPVAWRGRASWTGEVDHLFTTRSSLHPPQKDHLGRPLRPGADLVLEPHSRTLATLDATDPFRNTVQLWDVATGTVEQRVRINAYTRLLGFERDGHLQITTTEEVVRLKPGSTPEAVDLSDPPPLVSPTPVWPACFEMEVVRDGQRQVLLFDRVGTLCE